MRFLLAFLLGGTTLAAASFAGLVITPAGDEEFDIGTGVTTLVDGGVITDNARGLTVHADFLQYRSGEFVEGSEAQATGNFGEITAAQIRLDVETDTLTASGGISVAAQSFQVSAGELVFHAGPEILVASGGVTGDRPDFSADRLYHDAETGIILLGGPYDYREGILTLSAAGPDALLELQPTEAEDGTITFAVNSQPAASTLELFGTLF